MAAHGYEGVVVLGAPRSGTTLLRRLLNGHPEFHSPPETYLLSAAARFLHSDQFVNGLSVGVLPGLAYSGIPESRVIDDLRTWVFGLLQEMADAKGKRHWVEKTAFNVFYVDGIERLCAGRCRFVVLYRHALDVACSIRELAGRMGTYVPELHDYVRRYPAPLEAFSHLWVDVSRRLLALEAAHPNLCVRIRYEDLVRDPVGTLTGVYEFLGAPCTPDTRAALTTRGDEGLGDWKAFQTAGVEDQSVGRWAREVDVLPPAIAELVNPVLTGLGYAPVAGKGDDQDRARRRLQLELMLARMKPTEHAAGS